MAGGIRRRGKRSWEISYYADDPAGGGRKRRYETVRGTRKDAELALTEARHRRDRGIEVAPGKLTVDQYFSRWLEDYAVRNVGESTLVRYEGIIRNHISPELGSLQLPALRPLHLQRAYANWLDRGLSAKTVVHHHRLIREALRHACDWQLLSVNPADAAKPPRPLATRVEYLEPEQIGLLLQEASERDPYPTLIRFAIETGMRLGEILALRWTDVDLERRELRVERTARRLGRGGITYGNPKTFRSRRPIRLASQTVDQLIPHRTAQQKQKVVAGTNWRHEDLVFCGSKGQPLDSRNVLRGFQNITAGAGLGRLRFHTLRHTSGTLAARAGINAKAIADRLGHADATFTLNTYVHTTHDVEEATAEAVATAIREIVA